MRAFQRLVNISAVSFRVKGRGTFLIVFPRNKPLKHDKVDGFLINAGDVDRVQITCLLYCSKAKRFTASLSSNCKEKRLKKRAEKDGEVKGRAYLIQL